MSALTMDLIPATDLERWHAVLRQADDFDFYHLPEYHLVAEQNGEGTGVLFVYRDVAHMAACPFLLRPLQNVAGLAPRGNGFQDATSVYGYPGPICSASARNDSEFIKRFNAALLLLAKKMKIVSMFSRLNPLLDNACLLSSVGTVIGVGETVSVDLSMNSEVQWSHYRKSHRYEIVQARRHGMRAYRDQQWNALSEFMRLYRLTMERANADDRYYFDESYFVRLREGLGDRLHLFVAELGDTVCSAALFVHAGSIIQYHLSGTNPQFAKLAPSKVVLDEARLWGNRTGARFLHLGGGVGAKRDGLFQFKAGFSDQRHQFKIWRTIVDPPMYQRLVEQKHDWNKAHGLVATNSNYFPAYCCPSQAMTTVVEPGVMHESSDVLTRSHSC